MGRIGLKTLPKVCLFCILSSPKALNFASGGLQRARGGGGKLRGVPEGTGRTLPGPCPVRGVSPHRAYRGRAVRRPAAPVPPGPPRPPGRCSPQPSTEPRRGRGRGGGAEQLGPAVGGKSSLMLTGSLPSGQVCSAPPPLPVWKPLQAPDRDGEGARWVSPTSCCTVLRLACLQIHQIIHAKQPFRNHFLCFFETLLYSSICLI